MRKLLTYLSASIRHAVRSKLVVVLLAFTAIVQYSFLKMLQATTLQMQGEITTLSRTDLVFSALVIQLFTGLLLAVIYGLWMIPYPHRGSRSTLTYALPLPRSAMVVSYSLSLLLLLALQTVISLGCLGVVSSWGFVFSAEFPWRKLISAILFEAFAFQFIAAFLAVGALTFGQIVTFVLGTLLFTVLQVSGGLLRIEFVQLMGSSMDGFEQARAIYAWLPPVGEFLYQLRELFWSDAFPRAVAISWISWWAIAQVLLVLRLRYPSLSTSEE